MPSTRLVSSLPPCILASLTDRAYATYPAGFYVGMGLLLGLFIGYGLFRLDAAALWRAYRRVRREEAEPHITKEDHERYTLTGLPSPMSEDPGEPKDSGCRG